MSKLPDEYENIYSNFPLVVPTSEESPHNEYGFCPDHACPCHEDDELRAELNEQVRIGLISPEDATRMYHGGMI